MIQPLWNMQIIINRAFEHGLIMVSQSLLISVLGDGAHDGGGKLALGVLGECRLLMQVPVPGNRCWERITFPFCWGLKRGDPLGIPGKQKLKRSVYPLATCNWEWLMVSILGGAVGVFRNYGKTMGGSLNSKLGYTSSCIRFFRPGSIVEAIPSGKLT